MVRPIINDITEQQQADDALQGSEFKFRTLFEKSADAHLILDHYKFIDCNEAAVNIMHCASKWDLLSLCPSSLSPERQPDGALSINKEIMLIDRAYKEGSLRFEWIHRTQDGADFPVEVLLTCIPLENKNILHTVWRDITVRKNAEQSLHQSEMDLRTIFDSVYDAIIIHDLDGKIIDVNQKMRFMYGIGNEDDISSLTIYDISDSTQPLKDLPKLWRRVISGEDQLFEWRARRYDDEKLFDVEVYLKKVIYRNKEVILDTIHNITHRKEAERKFIKSERQYRDLVENIRMGVCRTTVDPRGRFIHANKALAMMFGYNTVQDLMRTSLIDLYSNPNVRALVLSELFENGYIKNREICFKKKEGGHIFASLTGTLQYNVDGESPYFDMIVEDITELKRAEQELKASEAFLQSIYYGVDLPIFVLDITENEDFHFVGFNPAEECVMGITTEEIKGKTPEYLSSIISSEECGQLRNNYTRCLKEGVTIEYEEMLTVQGKQRWFLTRLTPIRNAEGRICRIIGTGLPITERKQAEEELKRSRERLAGILAALTDMVLEIDSHYTIDWANEVAKNYFGPDIVGKKCHAVFYSIDVPCNPCIAKKCFTDGETCEKEKQLMTPDGKTIHVWSTISVAEWGTDGQPVRVNEVLRDVTERNMMQQEAMRAAHLASIGELAAGVAHEINNPINGIINYAQILHNENKRLAKDTEITDEIVAEGRRIASIVKNLLTFSRDTNGNPVSAHIGKIFSDSFNLFAMQFQKDGIRMVVDISDSLPMVLVQPQKIQQVFVNILSNARYELNKKYPSKHPNKLLRVTATETADNEIVYVRTTFHDYGTGIPAELIHMICSPFFSNKPPGEGTGLGLTISHNIIKSYGGRLLFESVHGEYTKVMVDIPARGASVKQ